MAVAVWLAYAASALLLTGIQLAIVAKHPEPAADEPDAEHKPRYAELVRPASVVAVLLVTLLCCLPILWLPVEQRPVWLVWASAGLVLVAVDARTTWLPIRASNFTAVCLSGAVVLAAVIHPERGVELVARALAGAVIAGGLFGLLWWLSRSLGFGDVRLAAMTGGLAGLNSVEHWFASLMAGAIAAACWGVATMIWRRRRPSPLGKAFPYGPGLWLGPWLGWAWLAWALP